MKERCHAIAIIGFGHIVTDRAHLRRCIAHGNARAGGTQHTQIVGAVAEGDGIRSRDAQMLCEREQRPALVRIGRIELQIARAVSRSAMSRKQSCTFWTG